MTEKEKKDIEREIKYFMVSLDMKYPDIPTEDIFSFVMAKASTFFVEAHVTTNKEDWENGKND